MFTVDASVTLPHPPQAVARVVQRLHLLPRWCAGLRRVRYPEPALMADVAACVFRYEAADVRLTLVARTVERVAGATVEHVAEGAGVCLTWTFAVEPAPGDAGGADGRTDPRPPGTGATRLRAQANLTIPDGHPAARARRAICRKLARRLPTDLDRLALLLGRYEAGRRHPTPSPSPPSERLPDDQPAC